MEIRVYGPLRAATGGKSVVVAVADDTPTVEEVLAAFVEAYPRAEGHLTDANGDLQPSVRVTCEGERVELDETVPAEGTIELFPAMRGG
ncbi:ubiquitin-like small modifier protein 1 [Natronomonas sp. EA1]|uniref:ubiquitin-like small modifier protein 1 n=1 Tax=Natronomonas sp. EA1 TaxID=3421655 RepID=UPI003EBB69AB